MIKARPSGYSPAVGVTVDAPFFSFCLRYQSQSWRLGQTEIGKGYQLMGAFGEALVEARLREQGIWYQREVPFKVELSDLVISGRIDFATAIGPHEVKTSASHYMLTSMINNGECQPKFIGQLVTYLLATRWTVGYLYGMYVHLNKAETELHVEQRIFKIELDENRILIDGVEYHTSVREVLQYYVNVWRHHHFGALPPKPVQAWACKKCPFQNICEENPQGNAEFDRLFLQHGASMENNVKPLSLQSHNVKHKGDKA